MSHLWRAFLCCKLPFLHSNRAFFLHPAAFTAETSCPRACPPTSPVFCILSATNVSRLATTQQQNVTNGRESHPSAPSSCTSSHLCVTTAAPPDVQQVSECKNPPLPPNNPHQTPPPVPSAPFHLGIKKKKHHFSDFLFPFVPRQSATLTSDL